MYAIIKTGGKQYRVVQDETLLVERLPASEGDTVAMQTLLFVDGDEVIDGDALSEFTVQALVLAHERGPKLRIVKFKPKRGYKRRNGHRQELTRIQITELHRSTGGSHRAPRAKAASVAAPAVSAAQTSEEAGDGA